MIEVFKTLLEWYSRYYATSPVDRSAEETRVFNQLHAILFDDTVTVRIKLLYDEVGSWRDVKTTEQLEAMTHLLCAWRLLKPPSK